MKKYLIAISLFALIIAVPIVSAETQVTVPDTLWEKFLDFIGVWDPEVVYQPPKFDSDFPADTCYIEETYYTTCNSGREKTTIAWGSPRHYQDELDVWHIINTTYINSPTDYDYEVTTGIYYVFGDNDLNGKFFRFENDGYYLDFKANKILIDGKNFDGMSGSGSIIGNELRYSEVSPGIDLIYEYRPEMLKEIFEIKNDGVFGSESGSEVSFEMKISKISGLYMWIDGQLWDENGNTKTDNAIYFKDVDSRFVRVNRTQAQVLLGVNDPDNAIGKTDFDFFTTEHAQDAYRDEQEIVRSGQPLIDKLEKI